MIPACLSSYDQLVRIVTLKDAFSGSSVLPLYVLDRIQQDHALHQAILARDDFPSHALIVPMINAHQLDKTLPLEYQFNTRKISDQRVQSLFQRSYTYSPDTFLQLGGMCRGTTEIICYLMKQSQGAPRDRLIASVSPFSAGAPMGSVLCQKVALIAEEVLGIANDAYYANSRQTAVPIGTTAALDAQLARLPVGLTRLRGEVGQNHQALLYKTEDNQIFLVEPSLGLFQFPSTELLFRFITFSGTSQFSFFPMGIT